MDELPRDDVISFHGVSKVFDTKDGPIAALNPTELTVSRGEFIALLGPSGCGKTTLLRLMAGLTDPTAGQIRVAKRPLWMQGARDNEAVANMGVVFQDANLFPWFTVGDNIGLPLKLRKVSPSERRTRVEDLARLVGISGFLGRWPRELSGGMRQRAAIARALSYDPNILLMDEPFGALDAMTRDSMNLELQRIWIATSKSIVLVTHSIPEAVFLADRIVLLSARPGRIERIVTSSFPRPRETSVQSSTSFQKIVGDLREQLEQ